MFLGKKKQKKQNKKTSMFCCFWLWFWKYIIQ